jgi:hypothetical protein
VLLDRPVFLFLLRRGTIFAGIISIHEGPRRDLSEFFAFSPEDCERIRAFAWKSAMRAGSNGLVYLRGVKLKPIAS